MIATLVLLTAAADPTADAIKAVEALGGRVVRDVAPKFRPLTAEEKAAGASPVISAIFAGKSVKAVDAAVLAKFPLLGYLGLEDTTDTDALLAQVGKLPNLKAVNVSRSAATPAGLAKLAALTKLEEAFFDGLTPTAAGLQGLSNSPGFYKLTLKKAVLDDNAVAAVATLTGLKRLVLTDCAVTLEAPAGWEKMTALEVLDLSDTQVADTAYILAPNLVELTLTGGPLTDSGLKPLGGLKKLAKLTAAGDAITGTGFSDLPRGLTALTVSSPGLTDAGLRRIVALSKLKVVSLTGAKLTDAVVPLLASLPEVEDITLENVPVTETAAAGFAKSKTLKRLTLSKTRVPPKAAADLRKLLPSVAVTVE